MVNYNCPRCGYNTHIKTIYIRHLGRKVICKNTLSNNDLQDEYKKYNLNEKLISVNPFKPSVNFGKKSSKIVENTSGSCENSESDSLEIEKENNNLICKYCNRKFLRKDYLENHLKKSCKMLKEFNNIYNFDKKTFGKNIYKNYNNAGDVYILQTDYINNDHYKIGITNNIQKRLSTYRCGNTYEPRLYYYISCQDIRIIDHKIKSNLEDYNVKREIYKGDVEKIKDIIVNSIKKYFKIKDVPVHEPDIKLGDLSECNYCNKCFYNSKDLIEHFNICEDYKEILSKEKLNKKYNCKFCKKSYSTSSNLSKHLKRCKDKQTDDEEKKYLLELVDKLNQQLEKKDRQIDELIKKSGINIGTQNNIQNIQILAHSNTDLSHLTDNDYLKCLKHSNFCIPHLIEKIHFNPKKPENHNIYISNLKNNYVMIYNGYKWMLNDREESIQNLIDEKESIIEQKLEEWLENGKQYPDIMKKFNRYLEKKENDTVLNKIKDEIKLMLFNNRDLISIK
jgi:hypothetical protein